MAQIAAETPRTSMTRREIATVSLLATAQLMLVLDVTVVNVALPEIGSSLGLGRDALTWVMTIYTTLFGGLVLLGGRAADLFGARRVLVAGLIVFTAASLVCAVAGSAATLLAGRAAQGLGAALLSPAALAVLMAHVSDGARTRALAVWGTLSAVGTALGVTAGGLITSLLSWQWIFAVNVPIGIVLLVVVPLVTRPVAGAPARPDVPGAVLVTGGTALIVYGLVEAGSGWASVTTVATLAVGAALWLGFVLVERRVEEPMLRVSLLTDASVVAGVLLMVVATGLMVGNFFLGSFVLQRAYGDGPLAVGLSFLPAAVAVGAGAQVAGRVLDRIPARWVATVGLALAALGEGVAAAVGLGRPGLLVGLTIAALGIGAVFVTAFTAALASARPEDRGLRSAVVSTAHELGGAFGVAMLSTLAAVGLAAVRPMPADFSTAFAAAAGLAAVGAALAPAIVPAVRRQERQAGHG